LAEKKPAAQNCRLNCRGSSWQESEIALIILETRRSCVVHVIAPLSMHCKWRRH